MVVSKRLAAAAMGGLLLVVYTPAWAGSANDMTMSNGSRPAGAATSVSTSSSSSPGSGADRSLVGALNPLLADTAPHKAAKSCKADTLYSQHDVIGDPNACYVYRVSIPNF
jgi:hypothetical protein